MSVALAWPAKRRVRSYVTAALRSAAWSEQAPAVYDGLGWVVWRGDNFPLLGHLVTTAEPRFDLVYLDPPYNCGYALAAYDDTASDPADEAWLDHALGPAARALNQHERWISLIYGRLLLVRRLLTPSGTLVVSIDSCEAHRLALLVGEIFGEMPDGPRTISTFSWPHAVQPYGRAHLPTRMNYLLIAHHAGPSLTLPKDVLGSTAQGRAELAAEIGEEYEFDTPKSQRFLRYIVRRFTGQHSNVLDPYAGSGSLGVAVTSENLTDGGLRRCTLIERSPQALQIVDMRAAALTTTVRARPR